MERVLAPNSPEHLDRCQKYATNLADYVTKEDWKAAKKLLDTIKSERDTGTLTKSDVAFIINNKLEIKGFSVHFLEGILVLNEDIELARCFLSFDELNLQLYALDTPLTCVISRQRAVRMGIKRTDFSSLIDLLLSKSQVDIHAQSSMRVSPLYLSIDLNYDYALQRLLARKDLELDQTNGELKKTAFDLLVTEGDELQLNPLSLARLLHAYNKRGKSQKVKEFIISCDTSFKQRALRHLVNLVFNDRDEKLFGEIVNCDAFDLKDISYEKEFLHYFLRLCKNKNKLQDYVLNTKFKITQKLTQKYVDGSTVLHLMLTSRAFNNIVIMLGANEYKVIIWNIKDEKGQTPLGFLMDFAEFSSGEIVRE